LGSGERGIVRNPNILYVEIEEVTFLNVPKLSGCCERKIQDGR
jgi:hypothetical protein